MKRLILFAALNFVCLHIYGQMRVPHYAPRFMEYTNFMVGMTESDGGNFLVYGRVDFINGDDVNLLTKIDRSGRLLTKMPVTGDTYATKAVYTENGQLYVCGHFRQINGQPTHGLARLNSDGSLDQAFSFPYGHTVENFVLQSDGKIIVAVKTPGKLPHLERIFADGTKDISFNEDLSGLSGVHDIDQSPSGVLYVTDLERLVKILPDGGIDHQFGYMDHFQSGGIKTFKVLSDERILVGGYFMVNNPPPNLVLIKPNGTKDASFNVGPVPFVL